MSPACRVRIGVMGGFLTRVGACAASGPGGLGGDGPGAERDRIDFLDARGNRTGSTLAGGERISVFNAKSRRPGSGRVESGGTVSTFDLQGTRPRLGKTR